MAGKKIIDSKQRSEPVFSVVTFILHDWSVSNYNYEAEQCLVLCLEYQLTLKDQARCVQDTDILY